MPSSETPSSPLQIVIIDDMAPMREALMGLLSSEPDLTVIGQAQDGEEGLKVVFRLKPDLILLDLEMPKMDGFSFLRLLMANRPTPVIVVSSQSGRESVFKALELGALEFVAKPQGSSTGRPDFSSIREDLLAKIRITKRLQLDTLWDRARDASHGAARRTLSGKLAQPAGFGTPVEQADTEEVALPERLICIGASTGGPTSILTLLLDLEPAIPAAILITQHMPENFTGAFAERLARATSFPVREAVAGDWIRSGQVTVAAGGWSLRVTREGRGLRILQPLPGESRKDGFVPSVDRMFESAVAAMGPRVVGVILTGMSGDGVRGAQAVHQGGGRVLSEAPESAVVSGMPVEVIRSGAVDEVVPLRRMADAIRRSLRRKL